MDREKGSQVKGIGAVKNVLCKNTIYGIKI
jgi:hypothetical protein